MCPLGKFLGSSEAPKALFVNVTVTEKLGGTKSSQEEPGAHPTYGCMLLAKLFEGFPEPRSPPGDPQTQRDLKGP